ncbi:MAG: MBL fold metallo-hydrolase [Planctomycetota bacterium]|nr:MAG: MBL fold metallo-hydrolase [Planctomycetota bacterium]
MEIHLLASGSSGNCALIRAGRGSDRTTLVLDCGIALRTARDLAAAAGAELGAVDGVLLSHHHADHCSKVVPIAARAGCPLWAHPAALETHPATSAGERRRRRIEHRPFRSGEWFEAGAIRCLPVRLAHDAVPTHGFVFEADGVRAGFFTDLGRTEEILPHLAAGLDLLVLEANHDPDLLAAGRYPPHLKRRVGGDRGHLSNDQAAAALAAAGARAPRRIALAHLSEHNNRPELALAAAAAGLRRGGAVGVEPAAAPRRGLLRLAAGDGAARPGARRRG